MSYNPFNINTLDSVERNTDGDWFYQLSKSNSGGRFKTDEQRLKAVLRNPAFLKVAKLLCDTFSLGKIESFKNGKIIENDSLVGKMEFPNFFQTQSQFLWDYMFWLILGTAYVYTNDKVIKDSTQIYLLMPNRFNWTDKIIKKIDKFVISKRDFKEIEDLEVEYNNLDGSITKYKLGDIKPMFDLSNGVGHWYKGNSSVDALFKVICNSELGLDAKGVNLSFAAKFMVNGTSEVSDQYSLPMSSEEAENASNAILGKRNLQVLKSKVEIKRYVDNLGALKLDEQYWSDYFMIGAMYNIPKELLESYNAKGSTFENQEKSLGRLVEMNLQPKGYNLMGTLGRNFGYNDKNIKTIITWDHLSFMQVFKGTKLDNEKKELEVIKMQLDMGLITIEEAKELTKNIKNGKAN